MKMNDGGPLDLRVDQTLARRHQIVLHSVLDRLRDMNLPLLSLKQIVSDGPIINDEVQGVNHEE